MASRIHQPETLGQARRWEGIKRRYRADGFCARCAAQAAFGHQYGFTQVTPCCPDCLGLEPTAPDAGPRARQWAGAAGRTPPPAPDPKSSDTRPQAHTCGRCNARWTGTSRAHCGSCHRTFNSGTVFDYHRRRSTCRDPLALGMICGDRGLWYLPDTPSVGGHTHPEVA